MWYVLCAAFTCADTIFCSVLQCVAACCSVLQRVAACCSDIKAIYDLSDVLSFYLLLQCVAVCCCELQCVVACCKDIHILWCRRHYRIRVMCYLHMFYCSVLQCVAVCCSVLQAHVLMRCCIVLQFVLQCALQCVAVGVGVCCSVRILCLPKNKILILPVASKFSQRILDVTLK